MQYSNTPKTQRINLNLNAELVHDLERLMYLSGKYKNRTHIIEEILQQYVDTIKLYCPDWK